jgi:hypothetical protein
VGELHGRSTPRKKEWEGKKVAFANVLAFRRTDETLARCGVRWVMAAAREPLARAAREVGGGSS